MEFIRVCKDELTVFGSGLNFDDVKWDVSNTIGLRGMKNDHLSMVFGFQKTKNFRSNQIRPFKENIYEFSKAYMRYMHAMRPTKSFSVRLMIFKALDSVLDSKEIYQIEAIDLHNAANWIAQNYSAILAYRIAGQLALLHKFLVDKSLLANKFVWKPAVKRPSDTQRIGRDADEKRLKKLPSQAALEAIPQIFRTSKNPRDVLLSSVLAILCSSPSRISEVMELPLDCEVFQKGLDGSAKYGLRWWPAKGALPQVKWIIPSMAEVVQEAIEKIRKFTKPAREIAKWYEANPSKLYLPEHLQHLRDKELLSKNEISEIVGLPMEKGAAVSFIATHKVRKIIIDRALFVTFEDLEKALTSILPKNFPYPDGNKRMKFSETLFLSRINEFNDRKPTYSFMFGGISNSVVQSTLSAGLHNGKNSIFSTNGFFEPDGSEIKVTTHQFRHYLNTLAQAGGMSQLDIAKWSGRKDVSQNQAYDHMSSLEVVNLIRGAVGDTSKAIGPLSHLAGKALIPRDEFARLIVPTAHVTDIGFCIHDYTMSPCQVHRDCINCHEMVCIKGDKKAERNIKIALDESFRLMEEAKLANGEGLYGAGRWLESHKNNFERLEQLNSILSNNAVPDGTVIQLASPQKSVSSNRKVLIKLDKK